MGCFVLKAVLQLCACIKTITEIFITTKFINVANVTPDADEHTKTLVWIVCMIHWKNLGISDSRKLYFNNFFLCVFRFSSFNASLLHQHLGKAIPVSLCVCGKCYCCQRWFSPCIPYSCNLVMVCGCTVVC